MDLPNDPRERAFDALLPIAPVLDDVLQRVQRFVDDDDELNAKARATWTAPQRAGTTGLSRFNWAVAELRLALRKLDSVSYVSTPTQEASNIFLWQIAPQLTLRVKREPAEIVHGTAQLFSDAPSEADDTVCLAWQNGPNRSIYGVSFVSTHRDPWSITLAELLAADRPSNVVPAVKSRAPRVRSARERAGEAADAPASKA